MRATVRLALDLARAALVLAGLVIGWAVAWAVLVLTFVTVTTDWWA